MTVFYPFKISPYFNAEAVAAALLGGLLLGVSVAFKTSVTGQVLGVSGSTRGFIRHPSAASGAFILGLILAGIFMARSYGGFEPIAPRDMSSAHTARVYCRFVFGGLLVGFGTALGNGCTSGHGLTGLARLSLRSWIAVPCFMFWAKVVGTLSGSLRDLPPDHSVEMSLPKWRKALAASLISVAVLLMIMGAAILAKPLSRFEDRPEVLNHLKAVAEFCSGLTFGIGLAVSTMVRPSKVTGFLDWGSGAWDPTLAFVMGGALCVTFPFFQVLERRYTTPILGGTFGLPPKGKMPDVPLVVGTSLFGIGWGTCGMCPGPAWVALGGFQGPGVLAMIAGMLSGTSLWVLWQRLRGGGQCQVTPGAEVAKTDVEVISIDAGGPKAAGP